MFSRNGICAIQLWISLRCIALQIGNSEWRVLQSDRAECREGNVQLLLPITQWLGLFLIALQMRCHWPLQILFPLHLYYQRFWIPLQWRWIMTYQVCSFPVITSRFFHYSYVLYFVEKICSAAHLAGPECKISVWIRKLRLHKLLKMKGFVS